MSNRFIEIDRRQPITLPGNLEGWLDGNDLAHFMVEVVEALDTRAIEAAYQGGGSAPYPPKMLLALLFYGCAKGIFSSRKIERATQELIRDLRLRVRAIIAQVAEDMGVRIVNGVLSSDHIPIVAEIPPHVSVSDFVKVAKGCSSRKIQQEFPEIRKRYWGRHFWGRGFFSTTSGNVTDEMINVYINGHVDAHQSDNENNITLE